MRLDENLARELRGARLGLLSHAASCDAAGRHISDAIAENCPGRLRAILSPQHGFWGEQQANMVESAHDVHPRLNIPIYSLYSTTRTPDAEMLSRFDVLLVDLQDVGTRVYTFVWTLQNCLKACAGQNIEVIILDRPNPLGGTACEGAVLDSAYRSFVGDASIPMRHGLTLGEISSWLNQSHAIGANLRVIPIPGWRRGMTFEETGLPWIPPSPNMPTINSAVVYPGQVLLEGTNLSEGRGTTTPFEVVGAPFIDAFQLADRLSEQELPGVQFRPHRFRPTFDKWAGESCGGVAIQVTDRTSFQPYRTTLTILSTIRKSSPDHFEWLPPPYEYEDTLMPIDILSGDSRLREWLDKQGELNDAQFESLCHEGVAAWQKHAQPYWLYDV